MVNVAAEPEIPGCTGQVMVVTLDKEHAIRHLSLKLGYKKGADSKTML